MFPFFMIVGIIQYSSLPGRPLENSYIILQKYKELVSLGADIVVTPELSLTSYNMKDIFLNKVFVSKCFHAVNILKERIESKPLIVGLPILSNECKPYNALCVLQNNAIRYTYRKHHLVNDGIFQEKRFFSEVKEKLSIDPFIYNGYRIVFMICEDAWHHKMYNYYAKICPDIIITINASPFRIGIQEKRKKVIGTLYHQYFSKDITLVYANCYGAYDEMTFDGTSFIIHNTHHYEYLASWKSDTKMIKCRTKQKLYLSSSRENHPENIHVIPQKNSEFYHIWQSLVHSVRSYVTLSPFSQCVVALSGGIDSCLSLYICHEALGKENVVALYMPSCYNSLSTQNMVDKIIETLHIKNTCINIDNIHNMLLEIFSQSKENLSSTIHNIQSRLRGLILSTYAQENNLLIIGTSNRTELALGYGTLYGDMIGAYNPLKDLYKTDIYNLTSWHIATYNTIPQNILNITPSAELFHNQSDEEDIGLLYQQIDDILSYLLEGQNMTNNYDKKIIDNISFMITKNEFKRQQTPPGCILRDTSFISGRKYPLFPHILHA